MFRFEPLMTDRLLLRPTVEEDAYRKLMRNSHLELEPSIYPAALEFRFHPGKVLIDILLKDGERFVGGFSLHDWQEDHSACELGYWIVPEFQGLGLMREGATAVIDRLFRSGLKRLSLISDVRNTRSLALARKLGFSHEGYLVGTDIHTELPVTKLVFARYPEFGR